MCQKLKNFPPKTPKNNFESEKVSYFKHFPSYPEDLVTHTEDQEI